MKYGNNEQGLKVDKKKYKIEQEYRPHLEIGSGAMEG